MRDSIVFYRSFYEAIKEIPLEEQGVVYNAIYGYALDGIEPELSGIAKAIFLLVKPQIDANNSRYENGKKGGKPKTNQNETKTEPKTNQDVTETEPNENVNVNVNENDLKENVRQIRYELNTSTFGIAGGFSAIKSFLLILGFCSFGFCLYRHDNYRFRTVVITCKVNFCHT